MKIEKKIENGKIGEVYQFGKIDTVFYGRTTAFFS